LHEQQAQQYGAEPSAEPATPLDLGKGWSVEFPAQ
jgi:hypothetical protein